jgi:hypothetical protein
MAGRSTKLAALQVQAEDVDNGPVMTDDVNLHTSADDPGTKGLDSLLDLINQISPSRDPDHEEDYDSNRIETNCMEEKSSIEVCDDDIDQLSQSISTESKNA